MCVCVYVRVCVCSRARARVRAYIRVSVRACVRACERGCMRVRACVCVYFYMYYLFCTHVSIKVFVQMHASPIYVCLAQCEVYLMNVSLSMMCGEMRRII